ncbi:MAG: hypothetical protein ABL929_12555 [Ferruginibacter sp.]
MNNSIKTIHYRCCICGKLHKVTYDKCCVNLSCYDTGRDKEDYGLQTSLRFLLQ